MEEHKYNDIIISPKFLTFNDFMMCKKDLDKKILKGVLLPNYILLYYNDIMKNIFSDRLLKFNNSVLEDDVTSNLFFNEFLQYWQEFYYLFYLSLKIIKSMYISNSRIISLGESPNKFIFTQSLFYEDMSINTILG